MKVEVKTIEFSPEGEARYKQAIIVDGKIIRTIWIDGILGKTNHMQLEEFWKTKQQLE